jgi:guanine deaminase
MPSKVSYWILVRSKLDTDIVVVDMYDEHKGEGIGNIDFFDPPPGSVSEDMVEKWWCLGDNRNRSAVYVQGKQIL